MDIFRQKKKRKEKKNDKNIKFKGRNKRELLEKRHYMRETEVPEREQGKRKKMGGKQFEQIVIENIS